MRIAKPLLAITTPVGVAAGLREAYRFHWWLAVLMALLLAVIAAFFVMTVRRIRAEARAATTAGGTSTGDRR
jgi:membrane protein implicated in regulation of membrane protease activity